MITKNSFTDLFFGGSITKNPAVKQARNLFLTIYRSERIIKMRTSFKQNKKPSRELNEKLLISVTSTKTIILAFSNNYWIALYELNSKKRHTNNEGWRDGTQANDRWSCMSGDFGGGLFSLVSTGCCWIVVASQHYPSWCRHLRSCRRCSGEDWKGGSSRTPGSYRTEFRRKYMWH